MKSREQTDYSPEQIKEDPIKDEKITNKSETPELYDKAKWEELKKRKSSWSNTYDEGEKMGVPQEELKNFADEVIDQKTKDKDWGFIYLWKKDKNIYTKEEVNAAGEIAYDFLLKIEDTESVLGVAKNFYGKDSREYVSAYEANEKKKQETEKKKRKGRGKREVEEADQDMEKEDQDLTVSISKDCTFLDLFKAIDAIESEEGFEALQFEEQLFDYFDEEFADEVLAFRHTNAAKASTTKVVDFFEKYGEEHDIDGYSKSDISKLLPIKFKD